MNHLLSKIELDPKLNSSKFLNLLQLINNKVEEDNKELDLEIENSQAELNEIKLKYLKNRIIWDSLRDFSLEIGMETNKLMSDLPLNAYNNYELSHELNKLKLNTLELFSNNDEIKDQSLMGVQLPTDVKPLNNHHQTLVYKFINSNLKTLIIELSRLSPNAEYLVNQPLLTQLNEVIMEVEQKTESISDNEQLSQSLMIEYNVKLEQFFEIIQIQLKKLTEIVLKLCIGLKFSNLNLIDNYFGLILTNANLKFCVLKSEFLALIYQSEILVKLNVIKDKLNNQETQLMDKLSELQSKLNEFEDLGPLFQTLTTEYNQVLNKIKIVENDINRLQE
ncbi:hypothetical protein CONCODRAFT_85934 [Conidiobolus coronatus NRRL 28638]|uniref:Uncharacterized protein n=1 Tax=Conidiobolus coronatus (strain ATCC 28846 / CBS 209.66 / NRRL 28638) TaxID=796925 RepID=A0A137P2V8_CONC2|nr:hypothetical protein CONCODRAFT_85934 [Conidiobolus coronatus NRRL 28638]|eukprot:KXN69367.1 hypothetical protein CONCODRAFT_85934 [Conidiobolus coronatus NRRL 28638]